MKKYLTAAACFAGFVATVFGANWALQHYGIVPVGFGLAAPAGVYFAGLAFGLRDALQETGGRRAVVVAILVGGAASWWVAPTFAVASAVAFLVSELADFAVYTPLRDRRLWLAVVLSNVVGAVIDSLLFLHLAGLPLELWKGQVVAKTYMVVPAVVIVRAVRRR